MLSSTVDTSTGAGIDSVIPTARRATRRARRHIRFAALRVLRSPRRVATSPPATTAAPSPGLISPWWSVAADSLAAFAAARGVSAPSPARIALPVRPIAAPSLPALLRRYGLRLVGQIPDPGVREPPMCAARPTPPLRPAGDVPRLAGNTPARPRVTAPGRLPAADPPMAAAPVPRRARDPPIPNSARPPSPPRRRDPRPPPGVVPRTPPPVPAAPRRDQVVAERPSPGIRIRDAPLRPDFMAFLATAPAPTAAAAPATTAVDMGATAAAAATSAATIPRVAIIGFPGMTRAAGFGFLGSVGILVGWATSSRRVCVSDMPPPFLVTVGCCLVVSSSVVVYTLSGVLLLVKAPSSS